MAIIEIVGYILSVVALSYFAWRLIYAIHLNERWLREQKEKR